VLAGIDWRGFDRKDIAAHIPENHQAAESQLRQIRLTEDGEELFVGETVAENSEALVFQPAHAVRMVPDIVPILLSDARSSAASWIAFVPAASTKARLASSPA